MNFKMPTRSTTRLETTFMDGVGPSEDTLYTFCRAEGRVGLNLNLVRWPNE
jgi:hypothetical protein